ncbi:MAG: hypothetical protein GY816_00600 [Cytophagales bacterium]|nr:hypothetical protein [Cytophagales bacterium]
MVQRLLTVILLLILTTGCTAHHRRARGKHTLIQPKTPQGKTVLFMDKRKAIEEMTIPAQYEIIETDVKWDPEIGGWRLPFYAIIQTEDSRFIFEDNDARNNEPPEDLMQFMNVE